MRSATTATQTIMMAVVKIVKLKLIKDSIVIKFSWEIKLCVLASAGMGYGHLTKNVMMVILVIMMAALQLARLNPATTAKVLSVAPLSVKQNVVMA